ncbi:unnamed protein product [Auanema sp. JU1783]|nr:unnamed protein product [Auanema sp. JU1783]
MFNVFDYSSAMRQATVVRNQLCGDPSDLLDSSTSSYNNGVHQYVSDFGSMEYSLQQPSHLTNNNNSYVYANDSTTYQYYQYSGNVHSPNQQYLVSGNHSPGSADDEHNTSIQHATRASPATIQWLLDNYEPSDGTSLPRCTLYDHYKKHCMEYKLDPVNAASFGKLIRNVFQNLRTRRLGTRGNSKYHYYGIRVKPSSLLNRQRLQLEYNSEEPCAPPRQHSRPVKRSAASQPSVSPHSTSSPVPNHPNPLILNDNAIIVASEMDKQSLGVGELPNIEIDFRIELEEEIQKLGLELSHVCKFMEAYKLNCSDILYCVRNIAFDNVSHYWTTFWQSDDTFCSSEPKLDKLTRQQIFSLCTVPCIQSFIIKVDLALYQVMVDILIPDVLLSEMTSLLIQACRSFAKNAESYLRKAMRGAPDVIQKKKIQAVKYMTQALRRYTSLNHLSQAARTVLHKPDQVAAMYSDCVKVDIAQVQEQAGWVCGCDIVIIKQIHNGFKENLQKMVGMNHWADWMDAIVEQNVPVLTNYHGKTVREVTKIAKKFLLHWSLYTSMLIRDLTLRSANSFGSFHLIRLLSDEYMLYLIESKLGKAFNKPTISVMTLPTDYPIFDDLDDQEDIILQMPSALPPISLNSIYMPHDSILYGDKVGFSFILGGDEHINSPVVVTDNGDMLTALPSSNELL